MATVDRPKAPSPVIEKLRDEWIARLSNLLELVEASAREFDWSTRRIEKKMEDTQIGPYKAPALLLQKDTCRVLLDPIARSAPGADGVVDLYLMPAYDDIASLYFCDGEWKLHYMFPGTPSVAVIRSADSQPLSKETLLAVLEEMRANAS